MPMPFDVTLKEIVETYVADYQVRVGFDPEDDVRPLNVDLSTVSAATDVVLGEGDPPRRIVDLNFQSGPDATLESRLLLYNSLLYHRYQAPVHTVLFLLRPISRQHELTGRLRYQGRPRKGKMDFSYEVIRLWDEPPRKYLRGGIGLLPLAPLCVPPRDVSEARLRPIVDRVVQRLEKDAAPEQRAKLLAATYLLTGLKVERDTLDKLFHEVTRMEESSGYQAILEKGKVARSHETILNLGTKRFGPPSPKTRETIQAIVDLAHLDRIEARLLDVASWDELMQAE